MKPQRDQPGARRREASARPAAIVDAAKRAPRRVPRDATEWDALRSMGENPERLGPRKPSR